MVKSPLKSHHNVIFATKPDKAVAFETVLLEDRVTNLRSTESILCE